LTCAIDGYSVLHIKYRWGSSMISVTVSPKYQVVIPKEVRESMGIVSGQKIQILTYQNRIELIPIKPMKKLRGFLKGIDTSVRRDKDRV
jgi:AbrB family looped-hinge helix DNA binding protein